MEHIVYHGCHDEFGSIPSTSILPVFVVQPNLTMFFCSKDSILAALKIENFTKLPDKYSGRRSLHIFFVIVLISKTMTRSMYWLIREISRSTNSLLTACLIGPHPLPGGKVGCKWWVQTMNAPEPWEGWVRITVRIPLHSHEWSSCFIDSLRIVSCFFLKKTLFHDQLSFILQEDGPTRRVGWGRFPGFSKAAKTVYAYTSMTF